jgi:hypothetical protein
MKSERVRRLLSRFLKDISPLSIKELEKKYGDIADELSVKLAKTLSTEKEIEEYLEFIILEIDSLNKFFKTQNRGRIPYSKLFTFANKDERISSFLFDKGISKKLIKKSSYGNSMDIAGFSYEECKEDDVVLIYKNDVYGCIYTSSQNSFLFSSAVNKLIVQNSKGKICSYKKYVSSSKKKKRKYISLKTIFNSIKKNKTNESSLAFKLFYIDNKLKREKDE